MRATIRGACANSTGTVSIAALFLSEDPKTFLAADAASLGVLRQEASDQGREANGRSDDVRPHDELLYLGLLSPLGDDLRGEALAARGSKPWAS